MRSRLAGIYMMVRSHALFQAAPISSDVVAYVGAFTAIVAASIAVRPLFRWITDEDHPLEDSQALLNVVAAALLVACAVRLVRRKGPTGGAMLLVFCALLMLVIAGEEISWGQRIFGFGTPSDLADLNNQDEFNLHNITQGFSVQKLFNYGQVVAGFVGFALPWFTRVNPPRWGGWLPRMVSPALLLGPCFFVMFAYRLVRLTVYREELNVAIKFGEWPEFCLALGIAGWALLLFRELGGPDAANLYRTGAAEASRS